MSQPDRRLFTDLPPVTDPPPFPSLPLPNPMPPPASAPAAPQHPLVSLATAAHKKPRKPQPRRPRPKPAAPTLLPAPAPPNVSAPPPQLPHHISQHPLGHMFMQSHPSLFQQQFPPQPQSLQLRAALLPQQQKLPLQTQSQTQSQAQSQQPPQPQQQQPQPQPQQQPQQQQQPQSRPQPQQRQHQQQQQHQHPNQLAFLRSQASIPTSTNPSASLFSGLPSSVPSSSFSRTSQQQHPHQQTPLGGDPRLAKFDAVTLEQVMRKTTNPQIFATLSKQLNFLRSKSASSTLPSQQIQTSASPFSTQVNKRGHHTPLASSPPNLQMGASPNVSQSALLQRQQLLQKQQLYNQHHLNQRRSSAHHSNTLSSFPFNATSQDPLTASLTQNIGHLPPHLHHLQAQLQSRQLQAQQRLQMHKSKANSSHSQASQATHSNSKSRRPSPSNKRPPRQSPKGTAIGVSDMNGVASSSSGARANPNHALSRTFEDTQSIGSVRQTDMRNSDPARHASQLLSSNLVNPMAQAQQPAAVSEVPVKFEIDSKKIDEERTRVLRERELKGRGNQKKQRLQHRPLNDYVRVHNPDYTTPFHGLVDAFERIVPFHVLLPPEDSSVSSEEWRKCTDDLSEKYNGYYKKLRGHCDRLHDINFEAVGEEAVLGQSSLTTEDSILMERILLDDYTETVRREAALAQKRAAEAEAKKLQELNRQRELLQRQARQSLSVSGALSPAQAAQIPQLTQASPLHPGPQSPFESASGPIGVSNGSVSASHVIVSAGAQAALWRQANPRSSQMLSAVQNNGMVRNNSSGLMGVDTTQMQRFATSSGDVAGFVNQGQVASSSSEAFLANRPTEQFGSEQYLLAQPQVEKRSDAAHGVTAEPKSALADGMMVGQIHMDDDGLVNVDMHGALPIATAGSAGSQVSAGVEQGSGNQVSMTRSESNSALEENSAVQNGASMPDVGSVAEDDGLLSSFNDDNNVSLNGHGNESAGKRNIVSSEGTPQSFGLQDGVNAVTVSAGNEGSVDASLEGGDIVGDNLGVSHIVSSADKCSVGESEVKQTDSSEMKKNDGKQEVGALAMGSLLNSDDR